MERSGVNRTGWVRWDQTMIVGEDLAHSGVSSFLTQNPPSLRAWIWQTSRQEEMDRATLHRKGIFQHMRKEP